MTEKPKTLAELIAERRRAEANTKALKAAQFFLKNRYSSKYVISLFNVSYSRFLKALKIELRKPQYA